MYKTKTLTINSVSCYNTVMAYWIVWLIIGVFFILAFTAVIIPRIILKTYASVLPVRLKVTDRFSDKFGEVVVYSPEARVRKYIKSYRVGRNEKGLYFRGEWGTTAAYAEYVLTAYGANNSILEILRVKEKFNGGKYTNDIALPPKTDYVTLRVACIDDSPVPAERRAFNLRFGVWLGVLCLCLAVACDLLLWFCVTFALRCIDGFTMTYSLSAGTWAAILGYTALGIISVTAAIVLGRFFLQKKEGGNAC